MTNGAIDESPPPEDVAASEADPFDAREALFTTTLEHTDRLLHCAEAVRLQLMLAGFDAMVLEEQAQGHPVRMDDAVVRAFLLHQAIVLRTSRADVQRQLQEGRTLRDRMPKTWALFLAGGCAQRVAGIVATVAQGLDAARIADLDEVAAEIVQHERPGQIERRLVALRDRLAPEDAIDRGERASARRCVSARPEADGQGVLEIHSTAIDVAAMYDVIRQAAVAAHGRDDECRNLGQLMADIAVDMVLQAAATGGIPDDDPSYPMERIGSTRVPGRKRITATVLVTVPADVATGAANGPASVAGAGTVDADVARRLVEHTATWTRVIVDPIESTVLGIDTHERYIPSGLKRLIHARNETCAGDDCGLPAHRTDLDHVVRYEHDGRTRHDNLQPLCRRSHQMKDEGYFDVRMSDDGAVHWRSKWGASRVVQPALKIARPRPVYLEDAPF